jgi:NAD(P)-dependent dehydrogenase (short-subunit alcohol dehydrogenase family)
MRSIKLQDKVVIITGASQGIGAEAAKEFVKAGARVVLAARSQPALERLATELGGERRALAVPADIADAADVKNVTLQTLAAFGRVDILVNNAGIGYFAPLLKTQPDKVRRVFEVNVLGPLAAIQSVAPYMKEQGDGHIINVLTCAGRIPIPFQGIYGASKAAFILLTDTLRVELAPSRIAVTGVYPGTVNTSFERNALREGASYSLCPFESGCGVAPDVIARGIVRAAQRRPRDAWFSFQGRRYVMTGMFLPDWLDGRMAEVRNAIEPPPPTDRPWEDLLTPR